MSNDNHKHASVGRPTASETEALQWHVRLNGGDADEAGRHTFARWQDDPGNRRAYGEVERLWAGLGPILAEDAKVVPLRPRARLVPQISRPVMAMAASLLLAVTCGYQYLHAWQYDHVTQGSARDIEILADGTRVALDTGTAINVSYSNDVRAVKLIRGRAYFDVRHDSDRPFIIDAGSGEVGVLGTAFSVSREGDGGRVVVERGRVRVRSGTDSVDVTPDQGVDFADGHNGQVAPVDAASDLAWSRGRLVFKNRTVRDVVAEIDRYYPGMIVLTDDATADRIITAAVNLDDIDNWLEALRGSQQIRVRKLPGVVLLG